MADCKCRSLLLHCCSRTTTVASPALQGETFFFLIHLYDQLPTVQTIEGLKMSPAFLVTYFCPLFQIAPVENDDSYDELKRDAKTCLSLMSQGLLYTEQIPMVLSALQEVSYLEGVNVFALLTWLDFWRAVQFLNQKISEKFKETNKWTHFSAPAISGTRGMMYSDCPF